jgi:hypothetical protein
LGKRFEFSRIGQRTRSDDRCAKRGVRLYDSEASYPQEDKGLARLHTAKGGAYFFYLPNIKALAYLAALAG